MAGVGCFLLLTASVNAQKDVAVIRGKIEQMQPGTRLFYQWYDKEHLTPDFETFHSVVSDKDGFTIRLDVKKGEGNELMLLIGSKLAAGKILFLYVDQGLITIHSQDSLFTNITFGGSSFAQELNQFHAYLKNNPALLEYDNIKNKASLAKDKNDSAVAQLARMESIRRSLSVQWIDEHPNSPIGGFIMHNPYEPLTGKLTNSEKKAILSKMTPEAKDNKVVAGMLYTLNIESLTGIGKPAPDFTQNDTLGKPVSLKDFRGKYVLLDFWASWCVPCRKENPNVVKAYNAYKDKNFTVLSVSLDQPGKKAAWLKAIHDDQLTWTHVSDLKFWGNAVVTLYDINAVPANFLISPDGIILARNVKGEELEKLLSKTLP
ncbi:MAG: Peroxiredoxin [Sediminibacterium sp.]|nr:Peroxiredoxin [Sediminibacterium sp.]